MVLGGVALILLAYLMGKRWFWVLAGLLLMSYLIFIDHSVTALVVSALLLCVTGIGWLTLNALDFWSVKPEQPRSRDEHSSEHAEPHDAKAESSSEGSAPG